MQLLLGLLLLGPPDFPQPPTRTAPALPPGAGNTAAGEGFRLRSSSLGVGVAQRFTFGPCPSDPVVCRPVPALSVDLEAGWPLVRLRTELISTPLVNSPWVPGLALTLGLSIGNDVFRGTVALHGGLAGAGAHAGLLLTPWRDKRLQGHGIELRVGSPTLFVYFGEVTVLYRWYPRALNGRPRT